MTGFHTSDMYFCHHCARVLLPGELPCGRYANGVPSREHRPAEYHPFVPYLDEHISDTGKPVWIESLAHRRKIMARHWKDDFLVQTDFYGTRGRGER